MISFQLRCVECGATYDEEATRLVCTECAGEQVAGGTTRGVLEVVQEPLPDDWCRRAPSSFGFLSEFLPIRDKAHLPPLPVGDTPLLEAPRLAESLGVKNLWVKDETRNPSGSTKDRASLLVAAKAIEYGLDTIATASTGNAATALAAVCASAGLRAIAFVPASAPEAKLVQMLSYGAELIAVDGSYDDAFDLCLQACAEFGWYNRNTALNPYTTEGKKTLALEVAHQLWPWEADAVLVPTGDGVIISGVAKGFADLVRAGLLKKSPRVIAVQPEGSAAIANALRDGTDEVASAAANSVADSLNVQVPRNAIQCLKYVRASGGAGVIVSDDDILEAIPLLAGTTGVFAEPAGAAAVAGLQKALAEGLVDPDEKVVLAVTGSGLKDVPAAARAVRRPEPTAPTLDAVRLAIDVGKDRHLDKNR